MPSGVAKRTNDQLNVGQIVQQPLIWRKQKVTWFWSNKAVTSTLAASLRENNDLMKTARKKKNSASN